MAMVETGNDAIYEVLRRHGKVSGLDLSGFAFDEQPLGRTGFEKCTAANTRYVGGELQLSTWNGCRFSKCQFSNIELVGATFESCQFFDGESGSLFRFCELREATFENCDLALSTFLACGLHDVKFSNCRMPGVTFEKPAFGLVRHPRSKKSVRVAGFFEKCNMANAIIRDSDFSSLKILDCDLASADLQGTLLINCSLRRSNLSNAALRHVDLTGADLRGADLTGLDLHDLRGFSGMQISASQQHHVLRSLGIEVYPDED